MTKFENSKKKFVRLIESELIGVQITFERENEWDELIPTGLVMYNYITKCFMIMTHKMGSPFFRDIIESERQKVLDQDKAVLNNHHDLHVAIETTGNY